MAGASADKMQQERKLTEVLRELDKVKRKLQVGPSGAAPLFCPSAPLSAHFTLFALQRSEKMLSTPSENIEVRTTLRS